MSKPIHAKAGLNHGLRWGSRGLAIAVAMFSCANLWAQSTSSGGENSQSDHPLTTQPTLVPRTTNGTHPTDAQRTAQQKAEQKAKAAAQEYIDQLADPDPSVRQDATTMLIAMGSAARPAILQIVDSSMPEVQIRARLIMSMLPWARNSDGIGVKTLLRRYGSLPYYQQVAFVESLEGRSDQSAVDTRLRILSEEMNTTIQWQIVQDIIHNPQDFPRQTLQDIPLYASRAAVLAAHAMGHNGQDFQKMLQLIEQGLDAELSRTEVDPDAVSVLNEYGMAVARYLKDPAAAQRVARKTMELTKRLPYDSSGHSEIYRNIQLIAIHSEFPQLDGLMDDFLADPGNFTQPAALHALAEAYEARGNMILASAFHTAALHSRPLDFEAHCDAGALLDEYGTDKSALMELELADQLLRAAETNPAFSGQSSRLQAALFNLGFHRVTILTQQEEYENALAVVDNLIARSQKLIPVGAQGMGQESFFDGLRNQIILHQATRHGKPQLATAVLDEIILEKSADPDTLHLALPLLRQMGRNNAADQLFNDAYQSLNTQYSKRTNSPEADNAVAWLLVQCNEKLDEAYRRAESAVNLDPLNGATTDTLAAVCFAKGDVARAAELEEIALRLRPGDRFISAQLAKFRVAADALDAAKKP